MTDIDTRTNEILARFTEKLATDDPLNVSSDVFVAKSVNRVEEKVGPQPSSLRTRYLLKEIREFCRCPEASHVVQERWHSAACG